MSVVTTTLDAPVERAFELLCDARSIRYFVAGARNIRHFDPRWPEPGTMVQHTVGFGPFVIRDHTTVLVLEAPYRLVLEAHAGRLGVFLIEFHLSDLGRETKVMVQERAIVGPFAEISFLRSPHEIFLYVRNLEMCRRLRRLVERRERQREIEDGHA